jgi:hypothetical protein
MSTRIATEADIEFMAAMVNAFAAPRPIAKQRVHTLLQEHLDYLGIFEQVMDRWIEMSGATIRAIVERNWRSEGPLPDSLAATRAGANLTRLHSMKNRIRRFAQRQLSGNSCYRCYVAGRLAAVCGDDLADVILKAWTGWPGNDEQKAEMLANLVIGFLATAWRREDDP